MLIGGGYNSGSDWLYREKVCGMISNVSFLLFWPENPFFAILHLPCINQRAVMWGEALKGGRQRGRVLEGGGRKRESAGVGGQKDRKRGL